MTQEHALMNQIKLWCGEHNFLCFHANVGKVRKSDGTWFDTGLPKGFPDLIVFTTNGRIAFVETKIKPRHPSIDQIKFINELKSRKFLATVCYSLDEFIAFANQSLT